MWSAGLILAAALAGCGGGGGGTQGPGAQYIYTRHEAEQPAKWTVLVYLDADNDLEDAGIHNFNQMESAGSTQDMHVIVQIDRMTGDTPSNAHWTDTRRYLITHDSDSQVMHSVRLDNPQPLGELDMANPQTLRDFVQWGASEFPADHYLLVVWDHGSGWQMRAMRTQPRYKDIVIDDTSVSAMNVTQIPAAMVGLKVDVIAFDACYMQQLEVAYELRGCADYLVGSCASEPSPGYNYSRLLQNISGSTSPVQMCQTIVQQYAAEYPNPQTDITQSAVDLTRIGDVAIAANDFAAILEANAATCRTALANARTGSLDYSSGADNYHNLDLLDYAGRCAAGIGQSATAARLNLQDALSAAVIFSSHNADMPNAHGLAIYVPPPGSYLSRYGELSFSRDTQWNEWLQAQLE